jgi:hypothetical protein
MTYTNTNTTMTTATRWQPWSYRDPSWMGTDLTGYKVDAIDGEIGKVDAATNDVGQSYLIVNTGPWIFGKKVMLPAGVVKDVDHEEKRVFVERTKDLIQNAPEFTDSMATDNNYRSSLGTYYGEGGAGWYEAGR